MPSDRDNAQVTIADDVLLPDGTRLVHIGPHKTGTTTLQGAFHAARRRVEQQGVHYASPWNRQAMQAARSVAGARRPFGEGRVASGSHWAELIREVERSTARRVLISAEGFADATPATITRIARDLDPPRVHVVATLRPLGRILPSQWQQYVQNGLSIPYDAWLHSVLDTPERTATPSFWHRHRHDRLLERWAAVLGPERVTAVVVDDRDHRAALRDFERLLGLRAGTLVPDEGSYNRSLTMAEVELVRSIHLATAPLGIERGRRVSVVRHGIAANMKAREPHPEEPRIETPAWARDRVRAVSREIVDGIAASGVRVIGDLELLLKEAAERRPAGDTGLAAAERAWPAIVGAALMGALVQSGLTRGATARASGGAWPDDAVAAPARPGGLPALRDWPTPRLWSLFVGRLRSAARGRGRTGLRALKGLRRATRLGRPRGARRRARRGGQRGPSIHSAAMQTRRSETATVEAAEVE